MAFLLSLSLCAPFNLAVSTARDSRLPPLISPCRSIRIAMGTIDGPERESSSSSQRSVGGEGVPEGPELIGNIEAKASRAVQIRDDGRGMPRLHHTPEGSGSTAKLVPGRKSLPHVEMMNVDREEAAAASLRVKAMAADMPVFMQLHAFRCARRAHDSQDSFSSRQMAHDMKKEFDKVYGPTWHCIVGTSFGSFVTHSTGCFLYFSIEKILVLLFKTRIRQVSTS
ncbi:uncharacterized protein LOC103722907 [Phoenix dactylifera]|uniref:Uncharacterized protein LOC103722907 n=1 Tax=Phoenix dactylifera TaxID=42345 RepID=A0A8B7D2I6_PHODC|nr:uncharacterized protein LOC103722907 [Phoenix dactylifera]